MLNQKTNLLFRTVFVRFWIFKSLYLYRTKQKSSCTNSITDFLYHRLLPKCLKLSLKRQIWLSVNNLRIYFCFILSWGKRDISQGKQCVVLWKTEHTKEKQQWRGLSARLQNLWGRRGGDREGVGGGRGVGGHSREWPPSSLLYTLLYLKPRKLV